MFMRRLHLVMTLALVGAMAMALRAAEKPSADYQKAMKDLGAVAAAEAKPGAHEDMDLARKSAATAKDAFGVVEKFWNAKGVADAVKLAEAGTKAAQDLNVVSGFS